MLPALCTLAAASRPAWLGAAPMADPKQARAVLDALVSDSRGFGIWAIIGHNRAIVAALAVLHEPRGAVIQVATAPEAAPEVAEKALWIGLSHAFDVLRVPQARVHVEGPLAAALGFAAAPTPPPDGRLLNPASWLDPARQARRRRLLTGTERVRCPVCSAEVTDRALGEILQRVGAPRNRAAAEALQFRQWACPACFAAGRALWADPARQTALPSMGPATRPLYVDEPRGCRECGAPFVFDRFQQRTWYETHGIPLDVVRIRCDACAARYHASKRISKRLAAPDPGTVDHALALARDYGVIGNEVKRRNWQNRADKLLAAGHLPTRPTPPPEPDDPKDEIRARKRARKAGKLTGR